MFYSVATNLLLSGFAYSNYAICPISRKQIMGYVVFFGSSLISWKSNKKHTLFQTNFEAEYRAFASLAYEIRWLHNLFKDLNYSFNQPTYVYCDNNSAIYLSHNPTLHERLKHIEIDYHVTQENIEVGIKLFSIDIQT